MEPFLQLTAGPMEGYGETTENECRALVLVGGPSGVKRSCSPTGNAEGEREEEELDLELGLSTNGRFGVNHAKKKRLSPETNIENAVALPGNWGEQRAVGVVIREHAPPVMTSSMPQSNGWGPLKESRKGKGKIVDPQRVRENLEKWHQSHLLKATAAESSTSVHQFQGQTSARRVPTVLAAVPHPHMNNPLANMLRVPMRNPLADMPRVPMRNPLADMPHVYTTGLGPGYPRVEGFLYKFKNGEGPKIVCVCHGQFFTPREFVKHGGGSDANPPSKHIIVDPCVY